MALYLGIHRNNIQVTPSLRLFILLCTLSVAQCLKNLFKIPLHTKSHRKYLYATSNIKIQKKEKHSNLKEFFFFSKKIQFNSTTFVDLSQKRISIEYTIEARAIIFGLLRSRGIICCWRRCGTTEAEIIEQNQSVTSAEIVRVFV